MASHNGATASDAEPLITIKAVYDGTNRKFKLPLSDLTPFIFSEKVRSILQIPGSQAFTLERFSDSGNAYITLDQNNPSAYKQLFRAAKAKLKLRIRATVVGENTTSVKTELPTREQPVAPKPTYPQVMAPSATFPSLAEVRSQYLNNLKKTSREDQDRTKEAAVPPQVPSAFWQIFCNNCDKPMSDAHFHCSICDNGDYDLCETCVESGKICPGEGHWLIKRFIKSGSIVTSATETVAPKAAAPKAVAPKIPEVTKKVVEAPAVVKPEPVATPVTNEAQRTCNSCVRVLPESVMVTCKDCPDYDLCLPCIKTEEGHHPAHTFIPIVATASEAKAAAAGRQTQHHAICDGCDEAIVGVRNKCQTCPDWDYCSKCFGTANIAHPGHRFVPLYTNLEAAPAPKTIHYGILCDGPLCKSKTGKQYIQGVRYKCAVCHDTDLCANCEAHPSTKHNESHPLLKFKTPVKGAHVTLIDEAPGRQRSVHGDNALRQIRTPPRAAPVPVQSNSTLPPPYTPLAFRRPSATEKPVTPAPTVQQKPVAKVAVVPEVELDAHFVKDTITDGSRLVAGTTLLQTWTLKNPGPRTWPAGSAVHFVGGDNMSATRWPLVSNSTPNDVAPGQHFSFDVPIEAPARPGKHISYWRLKTPVGLPFGHKLWCDIDVEAVPPKPATNSGGAYADYQMQLMLLEQQNRKRLMMARNEQLQAMAAIKKEITAPAVPAKEPLPVKAETAAAASTMVFPTLEKESPASSTTLTPAAPAVNAEEVSAAPSVAGTETETATASVADVEERFEDLESVEYHESDSDDDGFMTDEEYDILDASDDGASVVV